MSRDFKRRRQSGGGTSFKTYILVFVICCVAALLMQAFVVLTDNAAEKVDGAVTGVSEVVRSGIQRGTK